MKKSNPAVIGLFVIGGATLLMFAIALFSSEDFFTPKRQFVIYFQQSVNGLNVGSAVRFRGIPVGEVIEIDGVYDPKTGGMIPRVKIEFRPETLENAVVQEGEYTLFPALLANGLRANLKSSSLLTGQLYVALNFQPGTPERYLGGGSDSVPEMPSLDSGFDEVLAKISELPLQELVVRASGALLAAEELLKDPELIKSLEMMPAILADADTAIATAREFIAGDLVAVVGDARETLTTTTQAISGIAHTVNSETLVQLDATLGQIEKTLQTAQARLDPGDPLTIELLGALREIGSAARSVRDLADAIEEQPESLLRGKAAQ